VAREYPAVKTWGLAGRVVFSPLQVTVTGVRPLMLVNVSIIFGMVIMPLTYCPILRTAADPKVMGKHVNGSWYPFSELNRSNPSHDRDARRPALISREIRQRSANNSRNNGKSVLSHTCVGGKTNHVR
jgi:hypothetical protein